MGNEWQAIETAPKDGTSVLLYSPVLLGEQIVVAYYELGQWHDLMGRVPQPTHWMPLPKAPNGEELRPCKSCGKHPVLDKMELGPNARIEGVITGLRFVCECGEGSQEHYFFQKNFAIISWNTRHGEQS